ncbi:hypothetical protein C3747_17g503 [Trypanosoma cruzi]|uniref:Uncharacterized protein n=2 Tax=Trypanosoma cruzi TaxID=5693 RepID=Q4E2B7_TRYCC|nr:hypothetical protein, conserved [Trypanosoma cruzi]EAN98909.1 hypothetical protein, conserved [Trypanosoma cruzi]PWV17679.1 hypothetical protein C3747_17g503 [Trypanosoma cruzi]|eukprot:XP_820760.1 hypothetical protein [Trypanosoma cruzi strain CL Brener]
MARVVVKAVEHEGTTPSHFKGVMANGRIILIWVAVVVGRLPSQLLSPLCCLFWVVWPATRGAWSMRYPKGMAVRWSLWKPRCRVLRCVCPGNWHFTAVGLTARHAKECIEGQRVGQMQPHTIAGVCGDCVRFFLHSVSLHEAFHTMRVCVLTAALLAFYLCFLRVRLRAISMQLRGRLKKEGHLWSMHPRLQCSSTGAGLFLPGHLCTLSPPLSIFLHRNQQVGIRECCGELLLPSPGRAQRRQLHDFGLKGMGISPDPHRRRMPWTAEKECVPGVVHSSKEKMVLDGAQRVGVECVDRASQVYPLEALRAAAATCEYNTFRGKNIFNCSLRWNPM